MSLYQRLINVFRSADLHRELDEELEFHREMRRRKALEQGLDPLEAEREAKRRMGSLDAAREEMRDARVIGWLASSLQDLRHGVVLLKRDAGVSVLIILVLAIGIGGNAAMFTLLKAAFLDPLPYRAADRLLTVTPEADWNTSLSEYLEIRARARTLASATYTEHRDMQLAGTAEPMRVFAARVTASFFPLLGVNASVGRTFIEEENQPGRIPTIVLTDAFWRSRLAADPEVVGRTLRLDGQSALVVACSRRVFISIIRLCGYPNRWTSTSHSQWTGPLHSAPAPPPGSACSRAYGMVSHLPQPNRKCEASPKPWCASIPRHSACALRNSGALLWTRNRCAMPSSDRNGRFCCCC